MYRNDLGNSYFIIIIMEWKLKIEFMYVFLNLRYFDFKFN